MFHHPLYSIGHGTRKKEIFLDLLSANEIKYLIDVRSYPYSRFNPQYNQKALKEFLENNGIQYVFMGDALGGRPADIDCYTNENIDYEKVKTKAFFKAGIERLRKAYSQDISLAIMCSESKPSECHRTKLIGEVLVEKNILLMHIDEKGVLKSHQEVMKEVNKGLGKGLF